MSTKIVEICKAAHQAFNKRDFEGLLNAMADDVVYHDRARGLTFRGKKEYRQYAESWIGAFSNAEITAPAYIDAGDTVVAQFTGQGTNDGSFGPLAASGKPASFAFCEIIRLNDKGKVVSVDAYYDQLSVLQQLGHAAAPQATAAR